MRIGTNKSFSASLYNNTNESLKASMKNADTKNTVNNFSKNIIKINLSDNSKGMDNLNKYTEKGNKLDIYV